MRALIASDDRALFALLGEALAAQGVAEPELVGWDALPRHREAGVGLVLLDVRRVEEAAIVDAVLSLRALPAGAGSAIVLLVAAGAPPSSPLLEAGADDFVGLPCSPVELAARLRVALRSAAGAQAVRTLAQNEARFRALVQHSGDLTSVFAADGRLVYASPTIERVTGRPVGALLGRPVFELVHPDDLPGLSEHMARGDAAPRIVRLRHALGSWVHLEAVFSNLLSDPNVRGIVVSARDVTERERAAAALRESEESLAATLQGIGEAVVATDAQGVVVRMNPVAERLTGWRVAEARGRRLAEVAPLVSSSSSSSPPGGGIRGPSQGAPYLVERALTEGLSSGRTAQLVQRGGEECPVAATAAPIRDSAGRVSGAVLVLRDVTEEQRAAESLRRSEHSFRSLIERAPEGITVQRDERLIYVNAAAIRLLRASTAARLVGTHATLLVHPDDRPTVGEIDHLATSSGDPSPAREVRFLRADGSTMVAETIALPIDFDGSPALVHITRDVTERKQLESRLLVTDRMVSVGTLAAGVAHEINNPLAGVTANLRFLVEELDELSGFLPADRRGEIDGALRDAQDGAERVRVIVRDLKAFSRGDEERRGPVDLARVLESTAHLAWNEIRHRARLVKELSPVPPVLANEARLGQVFLNLIVNAAHAIVEGEADRNQIRVATREGTGEHAGRVVVEVSDSGAGISPENLRRLFDPFFTTKPVGVGTGLGLFVCHGIITSLGGEISVESEVGRGTTFRVTLPAMAPVAEPITQVRPKGLVRRGRVLVVDDEPMILVSVRRLLASEHEVTAVASGREALQLLEIDAAFDVILCDLMMPEMTGMDLYSQLLGARPGVAERMVFLTGGAFTPRARTFLEEVRNPRLEKPFDAALLRAVVREQVT